jgi:hypothetical protein
MLRKRNLPHNRCDRCPGSYHQRAPANSTNWSYDTDEETRMQPQPTIDSAAAPAGPQHPADVFTGLAYASVSNGIVRMEDRHRLARAAVRLGLRPFEAQLLIACAIRQKTLEEGPRVRQSPPAARPARKAATAGRRASFWKPLGALIALAASLDTLVIYLWLS